MVLFLRGTHLLPSVSPVLLMSRLLALVLPSRVLAVCDPCFILCDVVAVMVCSEVERGGVNGNVVGPQTARAFMGARAMVGSGSGGGGSSGSGVSASAGGGGADAAS